MKAHANPDPLPNPWGYIFPVARRKHAELFRARVVARYPGVRVEVQDDPEDPSEIHVTVYPATDDLREQLARDPVVWRLHRRLSGLRKDLWDEMTRLPVVWRLHRRLSGLRKMRR